MEIDASLIRPYHLVALHEYAQSGKPYSADRQADLIDLDAILHGCVDRDPYYVDGRRDAEPSFT